MTNLDPHNQQDPQKTRVMPVNDTTTNDDMPTQTLDPDRIRTQNAPTETMPPVGVNDDGGVGTDAVNAPASTPATDNAATDDIEANPTEPNADALPTQPIIGKPEVTLAGTEYETDGAAQPTPEQPQNQYPQGQPMAEQPAPEQPMNPQEAAWSQQQAAAQGYADEAQRNSYPGSGNTAQATAGSPYQNYPGWNQYAPNMAQPYAPKIEYRKGPSTPTIIWGTLVALFALGGLGGSWLFGFSMSLSMWTILAILALVVMGVTLVVGGVVSAVRRKSRKPKA